MPYKLLLCSCALHQSRVPESRPELDKGGKSINTGMTLRNKKQKPHPKLGKTAESRKLEDVPTRRRIRPTRNIKKQEKQPTQLAEKRRDGVNDSLVELDVVWNVDVESPFDLASVTLVVKSSKVEQIMQKSRRRNRTSTSPSQPIPSRRNSENVETGEERAIILLKWVQEIVEACRENPGTMPAQVSFETLAHRDPPLISFTSVFAWYAEHPTVEIEQTGDF